MNGWSPTPIAQAGDASLEFGEHAPRLQFCGSQMKQPLVGMSNVPRACGDGPIGEDAAPFIRRLTLSARSESCPPSRRP